MIKLEEEKLKEKYKKIYFWVHFLNTREVLKGSQDGVMEAYQMLEAKKWSDEELEIQRVADKAAEIEYRIKAFERQEGIEKGRKEGIEKGRKEGIEKGRKEGIEKGIEKGEHQKSVRIAKDMLKDGVDKFVIQKYTGLSLSDLEKM